MTHDTFAALVVSASLCGAALAGCPTEDLQDADALEFVDIFTLDYSAAGFDVDEGCHNQALEIDVAEGLVLTTCQGGVQEDAYFFVHDFDDPDKRLVCSLRLAVPGWEETHPGGAVKLGGGHFLTVLADDHGDRPMQLVRVSADDSGTCGHQVLFEDDGVGIPMGLVLEMNHALDPPPAAESTPGSVWVLGYRPKRVAVCSPLGSRIDDPWECTKPFRLTPVQGYPFFLPQDCARSNPTADDWRHFCAGLPIVNNATVIDTLVGTWWARNTLDIETEDGWDLWYGALDVLFGGGGARVYVAAHPEVARGTCNNGVPCTDHLGRQWVYEYLAIDGSGCFD